MVRSYKIEKGKVLVIGSVRHFLETKELKRKIKTDVGSVMINRFNMVIVDDLSWLDISFRSYRKDIMTNWVFLKNISQDYINLPNNDTMSSLFDETSETFTEWCKAILKKQQQAFTHKFKTGSLIEDIYNDLKDFNLLMKFNSQKYSYWRSSKI